MANDKTTKTIIDDETLINFIETCTINNLCPESLGEAFCDTDIIMFLDKNSFETVTDRQKVACTLGLIKNCLRLKIHVLGEQTIADAFLITKQQRDIGQERFHRWAKSESLEQFYENTLPLLRLFKSRGLSIDALTIALDVEGKQSKIDNGYNTMKPFFSTRKNLF